MDERFVRTALIFGEDGMRRLGDARVAVFGVGGVGGLLAGPLEGKTIVKRIYVPGRIFNVVAK